MMTGNNTNTISNFHKDPILNSLWPTRCILTRGSRNEEQRYCFSKYEIMRDRSTLTFSKSVTLRLVYINISVLSSRSFRVISYFRAISSKHEPFFLCGHNKIWSRDPKLREFLHEQRFSLFFQNVSVRIEANRYK